MYIWIINYTFMDFKNILKINIGKKAYDENHFYQFIQTWNKNKHLMNNLMLFEELIY